MNFNIKKHNLADILNLHFNVFDPLNKFVSKNEFLSIINGYKLLNGKFFPFPIFFNITSSEYKKIKKKKKLNLFFRSKFVCTLLIKSIYTIDKKKVGSKLFKTKDINHPGFKFFLRSGEYFINGEIISFNKNILKNLDFTFPNLIKKKLNKYNLKTIAGFHTRNAPHKSHEWIHDLGIKKCDGLLIHPMTGQFKTREYRDEIIIKTNKFLVEKIYKKKYILFGIFYSYPRYGGPREALLHALIRKNYGCTHFLIGRDHAGINSYYKKYESQELCKKKESQLGIKIIKFKEPFLCKSCNKITNNKKHGCKKLKIKKINGTEIRNFLIKNKKIPEYLMRKQISNLLSKKSLILNSSKKFY